MTNKQILSGLEARKKELTKTRDKLRELEQEAESLREIADDALDSLAYVIDRISELV